MPRIKKNIFLICFFLLLIGFSSFTFQAQAAGLVPCGSSTTPCTICHLIIGIKGLVDWGLKILVTISLLAITIAGVMYVVSSGSEQMMTSAKNFLSASLTGFAIVLAAWFIVNVTMWILSTQPDLGINHKWTTFSCSTASNALTGASTATSNTTPTPKSAADQALQASCEKYWADWYGNSACDTQCEARKSSCSTLTNSGQTNNNDALKTACKEYWNKYYENNTADQSYAVDIASCDNVAAPSTQAQCSAWCDQAGGDVSYTNQCKQGCYNNTNTGAGGNCGSLKTQNGIDKQCGDASPGLNNLLNCVNSKLGNRVVVSSISDSNGGVNCVRDHPTWAQCPSSGTTPNCCYHSKNSQHYAQGGSQAADFVGNGASNSEISSAITSCGGKPINEGNHVHAGVTSGI